MSRMVPAQMQEAALVLTDALENVASPASSKILSKDSSDTTDDGMRWDNGNERSSDVKSEDKVNATSFNPEMTSNTGTTAWCAPELLTATSKTRYSIKVDVYSFGMVLWELWERKRPFEELTSKFDIIDYIRTGRRPAIGESCPPAFRSLIQRCWQDLPARRPTFQYIVRYLKDEMAHVKRSKVSSGSGATFGPSFVSRSMSASPNLLQPRLSSHDTSNELYSNPHFTSAGSNLSTSPTFNVHSRTFNSSNDSSDGDVSSLTISPSSRVSDAHEGSSVYPTCY